MNESQGNNDDDVYVWFKDRKKHISSSKIKIKINRAEARGILFLLLLFCRVIKSAKTMSIIFDGIKTLNDFQEIVCWKRFIFNDCFVKKIALNKCLKKYH